MFSALYEGYQLVHIKALDFIESLNPKNPGIRMPFRHKLLAALCRMSIRVIGAGWSYMLMLVAMTFNAGLFMSVILGLGVGSAIFGPFHSKLNALRLVELQNTELCC
jgi:hypothetical protein